jgi:3D (Asp-Asp-Asp) domain-containing protein
LRRCIGLLGPMVLILAGLAGCSGGEPETEPYTATAYSLKGKTASGDPVKKGDVAADPNVLPLGSKIRVHEAGEHSGEYTVTDTGKRIKGRKIDIYMPNRKEARNFGRQQVQVEVLETPGDSP